IARSGHLPDLDVHEWNDESPVVRAQLARAVELIDDPQPWTYEWLQQRLADEHPQVRRAAAETLGLQVDAENLAPLLAAWRSAPPNDVQLIHTLRIALRNHLRALPEATSTWGESLAGSDLNRMVDIAVTLDTEAAALLVFQQLQHNKLGDAAFERAAEQIARAAPRNALDKLPALFETRFADQLHRQAELLAAIQQGVQRRGGNLRDFPSLTAWGEKLARRILLRDEPIELPWTAHPLGNSQIEWQSPFGARVRRCADGKDAELIDSIVHGEQQTGILRSASFTIPPQLTFWLCGHNGPPGSEPEPVNHIRLRLDDGTIIARQNPPRSDTAQQITWDLHNWKGKRGVIELVDADDTNAYAWLAAGRFAPDLVAEADRAFGYDTGLLLAVEFARELKIADLLPAVRTLANETEQPTEVRAASARAWLQLDRTAAVAGLCRQLADVQQPAAWRRQVGELLAPIAEESVRIAFATALMGAPAAEQQSLALSLATTATGAEHLLGLVAAGKVSARLLQDQAILGRLRQHTLADRETRIARLTANLPPADEQLRERIAARSAGFQQAQASPERGRRQFEKHCTACHQAEQKGALIGPQLDGIGIRGAARLLEDILDPNRNVDAAFQSVALVTDDGRSLVGLPKGEQNGRLLFADQQGKLFELRRDEIELRQPTRLSLMPANLADQITEADFYDLLAYLLTLQAAPSNPTAESER
ncbi:MAG: c-type cytochrome, partial [Planctomycetales bacterium]|nr:c-type cytochrome [Planctomycetales bacterium]